MSKKISQLGALTTVADADEFVVNDGGAINKRITAANLKTDVLLGNAATATTAGTVTTAAQGAITSVGTLTGLTVTGAIAGGSLVAPLAINAQTGTTYTLALSDAGKLVTSSNVSAQTITVPPNGTHAFAIGTQIIIQAIGSGTATLATAGTPTINSKDSNLAIDGQFAAVTLIKTATDAWSLIGALA